MTDQYQPTHVCIVDIVTCNGPDRKEVLKKGSKVCWIKGPYTLFQSYDGASKDPILICRVKDEDGKSRWVTVTTLQRISNA